MRNKEASKILRFKWSITTRRKTNNLVLAGIAGIFVCACAMGEQSFVEMMKTAETNGGPIVVELGVIDYTLKNEKNHTSVTVSPKDSDYTSTEKWYISGEKFRYEQSFSSPFRGWQSIVSVYNGAEYKKLEIRPSLLQNKFGFCHSVRGDSPALSEHIFGHYVSLWSIPTNMTFTSNFMENGIAVISCTSPEGTQTRIEFATNSGFATVMQIRSKNDTNAFSLRIESELSQWRPSSNWFPRVHRFYDHFFGPKRLAKEVFVKSVQFIANISNEVFQLSFPPGTKVWKDGQWGVQP